MYTIKCDGLPVLDMKVEDYIVFDPIVNVGTNTVGECTFKIYSNHPHYYELHPLKSMFEVQDEKDGTVIFRGRMTNNTRDFYNGKAVDLEGSMAFFNDTMVKPFVFPDDFSGATSSDNIVEYFLNYLIEQHNSQVQDFQKFKLGNVTVSDPNNYISRSSEDIASTWTILKEKLFESSLGGNLCIRYEADGNYIDYLADFEEVNTQEIRLGENLLDMKHEMDASTTYSAIIPIGAEIEVESEGETITKKLTLESIPDGKLNDADDTYKITLDNGLHAIYSESAVENYGWVCCSPTWDDVTDANNLKNKAREYLLGIAWFQSDSIEVTATDLHFTDEEISSFRIYKKVKVVSFLHNIEANYNLTKLSIDLVNPQNTKIVVGTTKNTLTDTISKGGSGSGGSSGGGGGGGGAIVNADSIISALGYTPANRNDIPTKVSELTNDKGYLAEETDPTVPTWAKEPTKPTYTADEVGADASGTAEEKVSGHNTNTEAHNDIRILISELTTRLNTLADSDDITLDQMSELVAYIKANRELIEGITTDKVNVSDIIDNLTTNVSDKPLSAAQGVVLKGLIDALSKDKVNVSDIVNDLTTQVANYPLSANQGVVLKGLIDALQEEVNTKIPTKVSDLVNDSAYIKESSVINNLTTDTINEPLAAKQGKVLKELIDKVEEKVPTKTSDLTNDSGFLTSIPDGYVTETELSDKGYLTEVPSEYVTETELSAKNYMTEFKLDWGLYNLVKSVNNITPDSGGNVDIVAEDGSLKYKCTWDDLAVSYEDLVITSDDVNYGGYHKVSDEVPTLEQLQKGGTISFNEGGNGIVTMNYPEGEMAILEATNGAVIAYNGLVLVVVAYEDGMTYFGNTYEKGITFAQNDYVITHSFTITDYVQSDEINPIPVEYLPTEDIKLLIEEVISSMNILTTKE